MLNCRSVLAATGIALTSVAVSAAAQADALTDIMARGKIRIAVPQEAPPLGPDMKVQGLDLDMANLIVEKLGVAVKLLPVTLPNRIPCLQTSKADIVISSLGKNPAREKVDDVAAACAPFFNGASRRPRRSSSGSRTITARLRRFFQGRSRSS